MNVGVITTGFPRFEGDCSGAFLLTLARALVRDGHRVRVLAPEPRRARTAPQWPGIELHWVPYVRPRSLQRTFYGSGAPDNLRLDSSSWVGAASFAAALYQRSARELAHCDALLSSWCLPSGWVASKVAAGRPHLCICHATDLRWLSKVPARRMIARRIAAGASSMWFLSSGFRKCFFEVAGLPLSTLSTHVGPMPIDLPPPPSQPREMLRQSLGIGGFTVLFVGRLVPVKGVHWLLEAVSSLSPPISVRIAGDGPERRRLAELARRLGARAVFEGWVHGERKEALFRACDAFVAPSGPEDGLPTVLFEARARGLPIISAESGAIADHFGDDPGAILVPPCDPAALGRAIERLRGAQA